MTFLLGSDICSYLMKRTHPGLIERVRRFATRELKVSVVTLFEIEHGLRRSDRPASLRGKVDAFLANVDVLPWDGSAAREAGAVRAELAAAGTPIGAYDLLIAGHARCLGATLVTHNVRA